jgi:hypothetical protein|tara:strand:- start:3511 stop:4212 length:702 start_codon:yes stop_codon:yes gene_type:complete
LNKSQISRDFWRKVFDENLVDIRNSDARNKLVNEFLANPENIKAGWKKADRRFFRLSLDKIFRERGISSHSKGVKPIPQKSQQKSGSLNMNIKTDEKKVMQTGAPAAVPTSDQLKESGAEAQAAQIPEAAYYSAENVAIIFDTMFNILHARYPECSKLTMDEKRNLGESWRPIFDKYLSDKGGIWVMPILATAPVLLQRIAEYNTAQKTEEMKKDYFPEEKDNEDKKKWSDHL